MGGGRWDSGSWAGTRSRYTAEAAPTVDHIYKNRSLVDALDPKKALLRESRDSEANPNSTALIVGLDVTGSMGSLLDVMAREGLGTLIGQIYERRPITDPHILVMGIGDFESDQAPLQVTQFEAENDPLIKQMESIWLERGGGGNHYESYIAAWLFAATRTSIDCFEKRGKRGYLFTVGDEECTPQLNLSQVTDYMGDVPSGEDLTAQALYDQVSTVYHTFHVIVAQGSYARTRLEQVRESWANVIGQNLIILDDHTKLAEVVVSAIQITEGADLDAVAGSWSGDTSLVVGNALKDVKSGAVVAQSLDY